LSGLLGPGATGKTALRVLQYLSLATGRALAGQHILRRCKVLMLSFEDDQEELQRRILAARLHHGIKTTEVKDWLFYSTPKGIKLAEMRNGSRQLGLLEKQLRHAIGLDPFVKLHALEENDNSAMDFVCDVLTTLAMEYDIAVDAPHHTRKGQMIPGDAEAGRGAGAAKDAGRLVYTLTTMSEDEAKQLGINPEDRATYVRLDKAKSTWRRRRALPNGSSSSACDSITATTNIPTAMKCKPSSLGSRRSCGRA
jgi:RecA-family ATPase